MTINKWLRILILNPVRKGPMVDISVNGKITLNLDLYTKLPSDEIQWHLILNTARNVVQIPAFNTPSPYPQH